MRRSRGGPTVLLLFATLMIPSGCASFRAIPEEPPSEVAPDPEATLRSAVLALDEGNYPAARRTLRRLALDCAPSSPQVRDRAALLLASVELDVRNPSGRPNEAATIVARMLARSAPGDTDGALARLLYVIALDHGAEPVDPHSETALPGYGCPVDPDHVWPDPAPLPEPVLPTSAARMAALEDSLAVRTDSLRALHESLAISRARSEALEAEIERIRQLLRGPGHFDDGRDRR
jgi:hypothetical protein